MSPQLLLLVFSIALLIVGSLWALSRVYDRFQHDRPNAQVPTGAEIKRYGQAWPYALNRWLVVAMPLNAFVIPIVVTRFATSQSGAGEPGYMAVFCNLIPLIAAVLVGYAVFFGPGFITDLYPEIAFDNERLWYRFAFRWRWVSWRRVHYLRRAQTYMGPIGILIYADGLPRSCASYSRLYGGHKGRAIVVFNIIGNIDELASEIHLRAQSSRAANTE